MDNYQSLMSRAKSYKNDSFPAHQNTAVPQPTPTPTPKTGLLSQLQSLWPSNLKSTFARLNTPKADMLSPGKAACQTPKNALSPTVSHAQPIDNDPANKAQNNEGVGQLQKPNFQFLRNIMGPYIESIAANHDQSLGGLDNIPLDSAFVLSIAHSLNTRDVPFVIKRVSDHIAEKGGGDKLPRMLIDRNLMTPPLDQFFGKTLACMVADPENFAKLHAEGESIGVCPEGQRGALTRQDTIALRGRGLTVMALKYGIPIVPVSTAGAESLHRDVSDLLGPTLKPLVQRPLDFLKDFLFERFSVPVVPGAITPSGPFPAYVLPPGQAFANKLHTEVGRALSPKALVAEYNQRAGTTFTPEKVATIYEQQLKKLVGKCYRALSPNGDYHNDDTERLRDVLRRVAQAPSQPDFRQLIRQLPTALSLSLPVRDKRQKTVDREKGQPDDGQEAHEATDAPPKNLAEQLANVLCDQTQPEACHAFKIVEMINTNLVEEMNDLLHTGHEIVETQQKQPEDAKRRFYNNLTTLLGSAHIWWLSHQLHSAVMPNHYSQRLHLAYGARVLLELAKDAYKAWWAK